LKGPNPRMKAEYLTRSLKKQLIDDERFWHEEIARTKKIAQEYPHLAETCNLILFELYDLMYSTREMVSGKWGGERMNEK